MVFVLLIGVVLLSSCQVQGKCSSEDCSIPLQHYVELGCTPVYKNKACPSYFNCPNLDNRQPNKCYYRGKVYNPDEQIQEASNYGNCVAGCFCTDSSRIICAVYDCAAPPKVSEDCYYEFDHNICCPQRAICPPFDTVANCSVNGTIYYEGQRFPSPTKQQLNCICKPGFRGKYVEPFCRPVNCGIEIYSPEVVAQKCAPVFIQSSGCPIRWQCPQNDSQTVKDNTPDVKCVYGSRRLSVGEELKVEDGQVKCECLIPPLLTCYQTAK